MRVSGSYWSFSGQHLNDLDDLFLVYMRYRNGMTQIYLYGALTWVAAEMPGCLFYAQESIASDGNDKEIQQFDRDGPLLTSVHRVSVVLTVDELHSYVNMYWIRHMGQLC